MENIFTDNSQPIGNLGVPVADEDNKIFWDKDGYNIALPNNAYKGIIIKLQLTVKGK